MSLIELMVGIAIVALLFALAAPDFKTWIQNTHIRTAAEAIQNGLMLARAEAVRRNATVRFQMTGTLDNTCAAFVPRVPASWKWTNWVVSMDDPDGACASAIADPSDLNPPAPRIIQTHAGAEGSRNALVDAGQGTIVFNGLGRQSPVFPVVTPVTVSIDITNPTGGACIGDGLAATPAGPMRCLRLVVSPGGQVRMCDPAFVYSTTNTQGC